MQLQSIRHKREREQVKKPQLLVLLLSAALSAGFLCCFMTGLNLTAGKGGLLGGGLKGGLLFLWNEAADFLGNTHFLLLTKYQGAGEGCGLFLLIVWLLLSAVSYGFVRSGKWPFLLLYLIPFFAAQILWDIRSQPWAAALLLWAAFTAAVRPRLSESGGILAALLLLLLAGGTAAGVTLAAAGEEGALPSAEALSGRLHQAVEEARFGTNPRGDGSLQPADFDSQETALEIKMETPDSLYLKGFTGSRYKDGHWEPLSCSGYYQQNALFYWLHREGFSGLSQMEQIEQLLQKKGEHGSISVKNAGACRKYVYAPYELVGKTEPAAKSWSDSFLTAAGLSGAAEYRMETLPNMVKEWPSLAAELFTKKAGEELSRYRTNESHYNVRMYEDYSEVTDSQRKLLAENIGREGNQDKGHVDYKQAISAVQVWLEENFIYTERIRESEDKEDPVEEFFRSKKGCDVHYASAAVLMFRYYGIPARYVEGYLITPEDIEGKEPGDLISIPRSNNHAWPEIYIDSFGWVPLEVTPEYYDRMEQPDLSKGLENQGASDAQKDYDRQNTRQYVYTDPESRPEDESILWKAILLLAALDLLVLALAYGIAKLIQKLAYLRKRRKAFREADPRKAVCAVYTYMRDLKVPFTRAAREIGNRAAYSKCEISEADRSRMLKEWERMKRERHEKKRNRSGVGTAAGADGSRL